VSRPTGSRQGPRASTKGQAARRLDPVRLTAWQTLRAVEEQDAYANLELPARLRAAGLTGRDAAFATELTYGTLRGRGSYDAVLAECSDRRIEEVDPPLLDALRLGAHQLLGMRVPAHAAVAATVDLVRAEIGQGAAGFANAVLRRVGSAELSDWLERLAGQTTTADARLSLTHSHPEWIVRALRDGLRSAGRDPGEIDALLAANNAAPAVTLVALPGLCPPSELTAAGAQAGRLSPYAVRISGAPADLPAVRQGRARVQDEGSQLVTLTLADAPLTGADGGRWLDLCAGPGGKAALLAALLRGRRERGEVGEGAQLVANEVAPHRAELVRAGLAAAAEIREITEVRIGDGRDRDHLAPLGYDRVLVDAPCTGLGALRRRPEARWRRRPSDLATLGPLQRDLLRAALDAVRPGGVVGYATCSPHPAETVMVVDDVLRRRSGEGAAVQRIGPDRWWWPHIEGCDAMYLALLRRT
jgi:16S rRNA (cytosine967-C5)-methyltransferase